MRIHIVERDVLELYTSESGRPNKSLPPVVVDRFFEAMGQIAFARDERDLRSLKSRRLEKVPSECAGCYSMRLNDQFRLILRLVTIDNEPGAEIIAVRDYH